MTSAQICKIKIYQREFLETFDKKLEIDWEAMNGITKYDTEVPLNTEEAMKVLLDNCINKHGADLNKLLDRKRKLHHHDFINERLALIEYSKTVFDNNVNKIKAAKLINRDRTLLYHFANSQYEM